MNILQGIDNYVRKELDSIDENTDFIRVQFRDNSGNATKWLSIDKNAFLDIKIKLVLDEEGREILEILEKEGGE